MNIKSAPRLGRSLTALVASFVLSRSCISIYFMAALRVYHSLSLSFSSTDLCFT